MADNKIMSKVLKYKGKKDYDISTLQEVFARKVNINTPSTSSKNNPSRMGISPTKIVSFNIDKKRSLDSRNSEKDFFPFPPLEKGSVLRLNTGSNNYPVLKTPGVSNFNTKIQNYSHISQESENRNNRTEIEKINLNYNNNNVNNNNEDFIKEIEDFSNSAGSASESSERKSGEESLDYDILQRKKKLSHSTTKYIVSNHVKKKDLHLDKEMTSRLFKMNSLEILLIKMKCFCCKGLKNRKKIIKAGEYKFFFYLDVLTYIKKMQEVDILKYLVLNADQLYLFNFLSKPSISTKDITSQVYKEFEEEQKRNMTMMSKDEVMKLYESYKCILKQKEVSNQDKKLIHLVDAEIDSMTY